MGVIITLVSIFIGVVLAVMAGVYLLLAFGWAAGSIKQLFGYGPKKRKG